MILPKGFNLELEKAHQKPEDYLLGAAKKECIAQIPADVRDNYLPKGERQNIGSEKYTCASMAPINILEAKFNYLRRNYLLPREHEDWLANNGYITPWGIEFSDRYIAILSGTTAEGNSLIAPLEAIRKKGLIPKAMFPQVEDFDEYYDRKKITRKMETLGAEFAARFLINYERVSEDQYNDVLRKDLIDTGGFAWPNPVNGEYPRVGSQANHAFMVFKTPAYYAFDNYETNDSFIKKLAPNYDLIDFGYRLIISLQNPVKKKDFFTKLREFFSELGSNLFNLPY